jgi:hypothetical protein
MEEIEEKPVAQEETTDQSTTQLPEDDNASTAEYIEKLNTGGAKLGMPPGSKAKINSYLIGLRRKYADAASRLRILNSNSPEYQEHVATMNSVNQAMVTLADQVDSFKENQVGYIQDFDNNALSKADEIEGKASAISKLYRGALDLEINEDGTLNFGMDGKYAPYSAIAKHAVKDFKTADKILKLTNDMYETKEPMGSARKNLVLNQVKGLIQEGGRESVISMINDGLIPGFENVKIPQELYKRENYGKLEQFFLDKVTNGLAAAAEAGYSDKLVKETGSHSRSLDYQEQQRQAAYNFKVKHPNPNKRSGGSSGGSGKGSTDKMSLAERKAATQFELAFAKAKKGQKVKGPDGKYYEKK